MVGWVWVGVVAEGESPYVDRLLDSNGNEVQGLRAGWG